MEEVGLVWGSWDCPCWEWDDPAAEEAEEAEDVEVGWVKLSEETEAVPVDWKEAFLLTEGLGLSLPASLELVVCAEPLLSTLHEDMSRLRGLKQKSLV